MGGVGFYFDFFGYPGVETTVKGSVKIGEFKAKVLECYTELLKRI